MNKPFIRIGKQELGQSVDGEKLTVLGHIIGYELHNAITVLSIEKDGNVELSFQELNEIEDDIEEIVDEELIAELTELWTMANGVTIN